MRIFFQMRSTVYVHYPLVMHLFVLALRKTKNWH